MYIPRILPNACGTLIVFFTANVILTKYVPEKALRDEQVLRGIEHAIEVDSSQWKIVLQTHENSVATWGSEYNFEG